MEQVFESFWFLLCYTSPALPPEHPVSPLLCEDNPKASTTHLDLMAERKCLGTMQRKEAMEAASKPGKPAYLHSH